MIRLHNTSAIRKQTTDWIALYQDEAMHGQETVQDIHCLGIFTFQCQHACTNCKAIYLVTQDFPKHAMDKSWAWELFLKDLKMQKCYTSLDLLQLFSCASHHICVFHQPDVSAPVCVTDFPKKKGIEEISLWCTLDEWRRKEKKRILSSSFGWSAGKTGERLKQTPTLTHSHCHTYSSKPHILWHSHILTLREEVQTRVEAFHANWIGIE